MTGFDKIIEIVVAYKQKDRHIADQNNEAEK